MLILLNDRMIEVNTVLMNNNREFKICSEYKYVEEAYTSDDIMICFSFVCFLIFWLQHCFILSLFLKASVDVNRKC